jgi:hypothetical protein
MSMLAFFAIVAMMVAVFSLGCGIAAMVSNGKVLHHRSEEWMGLRVAWQAVAVLFAALLLATAAYGAAPAPAECVYDYTMITPQECRAYRAQVLRARSDEERLALLGKIRNVMDARARERGMAPDDWRGLSVAPLSMAGGAPSGRDVAVSLALLAAVVALAFFAIREFLPVRNLRLMRCPETGGIAFVDAEVGKETTPRVRSCDLWPGRKGCAQRCLERYAQTAPGFPVNIDALRPFEPR